MRLGLSAAAAPSASVAELAEVCVRRGLAALELVLPADGTAAATVEAFLALTDPRPALAALLCASGAPEVLAALSRRARAPVIAAAGADLDARVALTREVIACGGEALLLVRGDADHWLETARVHGLPLAWQVDETCADPAADLPRILAVSPLAYVRLVGGGPEAALQEGRGIGPLMGRLALAGYAGPLVLTPSSPRYRVAWATWLGRRGGWGCGSAAERAGRTLHTLQH